MKNYIEFLENKISYQKQLCPDIWEGKKLNEGIEDKLLRIARDFFKNLELDTEIVDIQFVGSVARSEERRVWKEFRSRWSPDH